MGYWSFNECIYFDICTRKAADFLTLSGVGSKRPQQGVESRGAGYSAYTDHIASLTFSVRWRDDRLLKTIHEIHVALLTTLVWSGIVLSINNRLISISTTKK